MSDEPRPETREIRFTDGIELRAAAAGKASPGTLVGYAAVFNSLSEPLIDTGSKRAFQERIEPGAFAAVLAKQDIFAYPDHRRIDVLGRNVSGTMRLAEDERGLRVEIDLPDTTAGRDAAVSVGRRDVTGMSFGFDVDPGGDTWDLRSNPPTRNVRAVSVLDHVCLADRPAYVDTSVALRSLERARAIETRDTPADLAPGVENAAPVAETPPAAADAELEAEETEEQEEPRTELSVSRLRFELELFELEATG